MTIETPSNASLSGPLAGAAWEGPLEANRLASLGGPAPSLPAAGDAPLPAGWGPSEAVLVSQTEPDSQTEPASTQHGGAATGSGPARKSSRLRIVNSAVDVGVTTNRNTKRALLSRGILQGEGKIVEVLGPLRSRPARKSMGGAGGTVDRNGLNPRQEVFARKAGYEGLTLTKSYGEAGYSIKGKPTTIYQSAQTLADKPHVALRIQYWVEKRMAKQSHAPDRIRSFIVEQLHILASTAIKEADRLRAIELLGKLDTVGIFKDRVVSETILSEDPTVIRDRIKRLLEAA